MRLLSCGCWVLTSIFLLAPLAGQAAGAEKNIVFFITDDESPTLGCYGDAVAKTPNADALAADGTRFTHAFATTASCSASRSVVLTGLHNHVNGQYGHQHDFHKFMTFHDAIRLTLPRVLGREGYRTAQIGKFHVGPEEVYRFDTYLPGNGRNAVQMAENCREFISGGPQDRPFLLYFATSDPHRGGGVDERSELELKPDLFGNQPNGGQHAGVEEVFFDPATIPVPPFLPDTAETREELAQYYQSCSRVDQGLGRLIDILKEAGLYEQTLIVFTSDHGMAFSGGKTTVYDGGLRVPFLVRNPYEPHRGVVSSAMISHVDITPSLLDFAGGLNPQTNAPKNLLDADEYWEERGENLKENRRGRFAFDHYHGRSWLPILGRAEAKHRDAIYASHTFHEIQMYYPMRVVRDRDFKLIWNIAAPLPYPFASDLWAASSWQAQYRQGLDAPYGTKTVGEYIHRPYFELYEISSDPNESKNLADDPRYADTLEVYKKKLRDFQQEMKDPWILKWEYE